VILADAGGFREFWEEVINAVVARSVLNCGTFIEKKIDMTDYQPVVAEPRAKAQIDDVVQVLSGQGGPASKIEAAIMVELLKSLKCAGAVFVRHRSLNCAPAVR